MPAGDLDGAPPPLRPFRGFSSYADDTPRELEDDPPQTDSFDDFDPLEPPHDDLRFAAPVDRMEEAPTSRRFGAAVAVGALVVVVGVGAGLILVRGGLSRPPLAAPQTSLMTPAPASSGVDVAAVADAPAPTHNVVARLSELRAAPGATPASRPPSTAGPAPSPRTVRPPQLSPPAPKPPARWMIPPPTRVAVAPPPRFVDGNASSPAAAQAPAPAPAVAPVREAALAEAAPAPPPQIRASFDCRDARTPSQQMVCSDPRLAEADRRMNRAYQAALAAGAPQEDLRYEQADWLAIREDAARRSKRAVMNIYEQRTEELEALAAQYPR
jgi:uncharacterized protein YecT (DUF1311 family)